MGFLQRGFAWGNKRGFAVKQLSPEIVLSLIRFIVGQFQGGGGRADRTETFLTTSLQPLTGGGGKADKTETFLTTSVVLSLGSYP